MPQEETGYHDIESDKSQSVTAEVTNIYATCKRKLWKFLQLNLWFKDFDSHSSIKCQLNPKIVNANLPFLCARRELNHFVSEEIFSFTSIDFRLCHINVESQRDTDGCNLWKKKQTDHINLALILISNGN